MYRFSLTAWSMALVASLAVLPARSLLHVASSIRSGAKKDAILPIYWVHIPKSGSSFETVIAHSTCGSRIPADVQVQEPNGFFKQFSQVCPTSEFLRFRSGHSPLEQRPEVLRHVVVMLRSPRQRILSGYYAAGERLHDCPQLRQAFHCSRQTGCDGNVTLSGSNSRLTNPSVVPPIAYANCVAECSTRMLTGLPCNRTSHREPASLPRALENLAKAGFVGLTDEWELSVCLWHARFGGSPLLSELSNTRPGPAASQRYDEAQLLGRWRPHKDDAVFAAGKKRFERELQEFGVSRELCTQWIEKEARTPWADHMRLRLPVAQLTYNED